MVMMLRPTESKILFLQQLGRGLRKCNGKEKLIVLDFIGNHKSFLHKPQALFGIEANFKKLAGFARQVEAQRLQLPDGCYVNYDLKLIEFLKSLDSDGIKNDYIAMRDSLDRRPTLAEFYRSGVSMQSMRNDYGSWFALVEEMGDLHIEEQQIAATHRAFLRDLEITAMTKSFKMVLLEAFQELNGWDKAPTISALAERSWQVLQRRRSLLSDLPTAQLQWKDGTSDAWHRYWLENPINAWTGATRTVKSGIFFEVINGIFKPSFALSSHQRERFEAMVQELIDYRLAAYEIRRVSAEAPDNVLSSI
ncbi:MULTISPECIES: hypothetical protein [unclassified Duganella]|uniref:hypothetical protein n=1 Tax=unclassified Duganella TaxID=2636909 RepID=UPI000E342AB9|nr:MULTISPECIES: hypothetical protein [unclassified Duganella]RFP09100.1 hypothetical protein D0T26_30150 [Duganella sp. BJB489]